MAARTPRLLPLVSGRLEPVARWTSPGRAGSARGVWAEPDGEELSAIAPMGEQLEGLEETVHAGIPDVVPARRIRAERALTAVDERWIVPPRDVATPSTPAEPPPPAIAESM